MPRDFGSTCAGSSVDDLRALVAGRWRLPAPEENRLVDYLERHAEGNPLYAKELLRTLEEEGLLRQVGEIAGSWTKSTALSSHPISARSSRAGWRVWARRCASRWRWPPSSARRCRSTSGRASWGWTRTSCWPIIEQAVEAHLLEAEFVGTRVRFVHALTREALYEGVLAPRRRVWHRQVGEALVESVSPEPDAVAYHFQQAGDPRAWEWLVRAGERAQRAYAWLTATERFAAAAELLEDVSGQERTRGWLLYRCGRLQRYSQPALGIDDLAEAERLAHVVHDRTLAADAQILAWYPAVLCRRFSPRAGGPGRRRDRARGASHRRSLPKRYHVRLVRRFAASQRDRWHRRLRLGRDPAQRARRESPPRHAALVLCRRWPPG